MIGDVVVTAGCDGTIYGFDHDSGDEVWRYETGARINAWPAAQDGMLIWPVGGGAYPRLIAFKPPSPPP